MRLNSIIRYFDLASEGRKSAATGYIDVEEQPLHWAPQYIALFLGIVVQRFFGRYLETGQWDFRGLWGWALAALILGIMAFPAVYKSTFDPRKPLFVQLCVIFASGMGWESLVQIGGKTVTGT